MKEETWCEDVVRLWCFGPVTIRSVIPRINERYRWARVMVVTRAELPTWARSFSGEPYVLCETYGEYNGCLGVPECGYEASNLNSLMGTLRKKHPTWSEGKLRRAVEESLGKAKRQANEAGCAYDPKEVLTFLHEMCSLGPIVLCLADSADRKVVSADGFESTPRFEDAITVPLREMAGHFPPLQYWVPVTVTLD